MCKWLMTVHLAVGLIVLCGCKQDLQSDAPAASPRPRTAAKASQEKVPQVKWTIELAGSGLDKPTTFTFEQLGAMPMTKLGDVLMLKTHEGDELTGWEGPALDTLLAAARIKPGPMTLRLEAADGYEKTATLAELEGAIVALKDGKGRWLTESKNRSIVRLVPPKKPGDYWISHLSRITVEPQHRTASNG